MKSIAGKPHEIPIALHIANGDIPLSDLARKYNLSYHTVSNYKSSTDFVIMLSKLAYAGEIGVTLWRAMLPGLQPSLASNEKNIVIRLQDGTIETPENALITATNQMRVKSELSEDPLLATMQLRKGLQHMANDAMGIDPVIAIRASEAALGHAKFEIEQGEKNVKTEDAESRERDYESMVFIVRGESDEILEGS